MKERCASCHKTSRVLFITPQPFFSERGSPFRVKATVEALVELGFEVDLLCLPLGSELSIKNVRIVRSWNILALQHLPIGPSIPKFILDIFLALKAAQLVFSKKYAKIHGVEEGAFIACVLGKLAKTPFVMDMHSCMPQQVSGMEISAKGLLVRILEKLEKMALSRASAVMTVSDDITKYASEKTSSHTPCLTLFDLPIELPQPQNERRDQLQLQYNPANRPIVLYTGNLKEYQGVPLLLESFEILLKDVSNPQRPLLLVVGGGEDEKAVALSLRKWVESRGLSEDILFTGSRPADEMPIFFELADIFVSPRISGTNTPLKIYSYLAAEKPIVATDILSHTYALNSKCCFLADPTPISFAKALHEALKTDQEALSKKEQMRLASKALLHERFSREIFIDRLAKLYHPELPAPEDSPAAQPQQA